MSEPLLVSNKDAARLLGVCLRTLDNLVAGRELIPVRIGSRRLFRRAALESFTKRDHATGMAGRPKQTTRSA